jgi:proline iminopeptidase
MEMKVRTIRAIVRLAPALFLACAAFAVEKGAADPAAGKESGKLFHGRSATLYYEELGTVAGVPLMIVNGGPGVDHTYMHCSDAWNLLAEHRHVVFYDQRGVGRSTPLQKGQSCTLADQIADLEALRSHLGFERMDLLGHSWGGYLVMAYAARFPSRVGHLVICDSAAPKLKDTVFLFKDVFPETVARQDGLSFAETLGDSAATQESFLQYLSMLFYSTEHRDQYMAQAKPRLNKAVNEAVVADLDKYDLGPELKKFRFPTLVINGRFDANVAPSVAYKIHESIPGSRLVLFERSGHLPFFEERDDFVRLVEGFLTGP